MRRAYQVRKGNKDIPEGGRNNCKDAEMFILRTQDLTSCSMRELQIIC